MMNWVTNISVGLDSTPSLTSLTTCIGARSKGLRKGAQGDVFNTLSFRNRQKLWLDHDTRINNPGQQCFEPIGKFTIGFSTTRLEVEN